MSAHLMADSRREYERGYHDGREGKSYNDGFDAGTALTTLGMAGGPRENAKDYGQGYKDGKEDRKR